MTTPCTNCDARGLISSGANPKDLSVGRKETCPVCSGRGQIFSAEEENKEIVSSAPVDSADAPKVEGSSDLTDTSENSGEPLPIMPNIGDACRMDDDTLGVLAKTDAGAWICIPKLEVA